MRNSSTYKKNETNSPEESNNTNSEETIITEIIAEEPNYDEDNRTYIWLCLAALTVLALGYFIG